MRIPRFRFSVRWMMIAVAIVGLVLFVFQWWWISEVEPLRRAFRSEGEWHAEIARRYRFTLAQRPSKYDRQLAEWFEERSRQ